MLSYSLIDLSVCLGGPAVLQLKFEEPLVDLDAITAQVLNYTFQNHHFFPLSGLNQFNF